MLRLWYVTEFGYLDKQEGPGMTDELTQWSGPCGVPRFAAISDDDFAPVFAAALAGAEAEMEAIAANPAPPDFDNTLAAMEAAGDALNRVLAVFYTLASVDSNPAREALQRDFAPKLADYSSRMAMDPRLYARVAAVAEGAGDLSPEDARLVSETLLHLQRAGAALEGADRDRMAEIASRMAVLTTQFAQNVLTDERDFVLPVPEDRQQGLPGWLRAAMRAAAVERGLDGAVVTLNRALITPFLEHADDRALREAAFRGWGARGSGAGAGAAATDNRAVIAEILALRHEKARLLGFDDFAAYKLAPEMAGCADQVQALLEQVWRPALARVTEDGVALEAMLRADGVNGPLAGWDWRYYAARRRHAEQAFDEAALKPYLTLDAMIAAAFDVAGRLWGVEFAPIDLPLWADDVRGWQVRRDGRDIALFIGDYYARPGKRSGAWCSALQKAHKMGAGQRPIVVNVCNFTPPEAPGAPSYLSWDDARTLFHEFGHATHHILTDVTWPSLSGTSVAQDFVELPSQLYEHWLEQPQVLAAHARHVDTGAALPEALRQAVLAAERAGQGFASVEYLESALVDLALHQGAPAADPMARAQQVLADLGAPEAIPMRHGVPHFSHIFAGGAYAAGYYSYLWSEVMDADAFAAFEEVGDVFDRDVAQRLEQAILSRGGSAPAEALWQEFRGRMPGVEPLLRGRGLV